MLKKIIISNINSIKSCELDFQKGKYTFANENVLQDIVNPIAIYGHNGSGKSSVIKAFMQLIGLLTAPTAFIVPFTINQFNIEKYNNNSSKKLELLTGSMQLDFDLDNASFEYVIETVATGYVGYEKLSKNGEVYFERKNNKYSINQKDVEITNYSLIVPLLRILAAEDIADATIQSVYTYLSAFTYIDALQINRGPFIASRFFNNVNMNELLANKANEVNSLLSEYKNFPSYKIVKKTSINPNGVRAQAYNVVYDERGFNKSLPIELMSDGMKNQSTLLSILLSLPHNSVIFIDEMDSALHPSTIESFLKVVRDKKIQVVFSIHNTYPLQFLRPDQVYFAKWSKGYSTLFRLSKIYPNIREINNIEKMYLASTFDGVMDGLD